VDFELNSEQQLLHSSAEKFVRDHGDVTRHRQAIATVEGFDESIWHGMTSLGWPALAVDSCAGGLGGNCVDLMVLMQQLGAGLLAEPYLSSAVCAGGALNVAAVNGNEAAMATLAALAEHGLLLAFAHEEVNTRGRLAWVTCGARQDGASWLLEGDKFAVGNGHCAQQFVVTARARGSAGDSEGLVVLLVSQPDDVQRTPVRLLDGRRAAHLRFHQTRVPASQVLAEGEAALQLLQQVRRRALVAIGGEALGIVKALIEATCEYTRLRHQFGQPLSKFQVLAHRMVDMYLLQQELTSLVYNAAIQVDEAGATADAAVAMMKVKLGEAGRFIGQQAIQLHGGIGMTDELIIGHYFKRLLVLNQLFGDDNKHLDELVVTRAA
jgi:alkylation response protein AidB-like acyl-CoA dehydrogenase